MKRKNEPYYFRLYALFSYFYLAKSQKHGAEQDPEELESLKSQASYGKNS